MAYNHGVRTLENPTSLTVPITGTAGLQVVVGVAPVNMADDPYSCTNTPMLAYSFAEASAAVDIMTTSQIITFAKVLTHLSV